MIHVVQLEIDERIGYHRNLRNPNTHKGMLWNLFDHHNLPENSGGWLFRVDKVEDKFKFLVLSTLDPNIESLKSNGIEINSTVISEDVFKKGKRFYFSTRVNPVITSRDSGKRMPMENDKVPIWIAKKMSEGAKCICKVENTGIQRSFKKDHLIVHHSVDVVGGLEITDSNRFVQILTNGIGHAKRYGFGLIALRRA